MRSSTQGKETKTRKKGALSELGGCGCHDVIALISINSCQAGAGSPGKQLNAARQACPGTQLLILLSLYRYEKEFEGVQDVFELQVGLGSSFGRL